MISSNRATQARWRAPSAAAVGLAWLFAGCGGIENAPWAPRPTSEAAEAPAPAQALAPAASPLQVRAAPLAEAQHGIPYAHSFTLDGALRPSDVCWRVAEGALPPGITLDVRTGLLGGRPAAGSPGVATFRVEAYSPCEATSPSPAASGHSGWLALAYGGRCTWDLECPVGESCRHDGTCRADFGAECPRPIGPALRFDYLDGPDASAWGLDATEAVASARHWIALEVERNGFARVDARDGDGDSEASGALAPRGARCEPTEHELVLVEPGSRARHRLCYRLPGELRVPVSAGDLIDLALFRGPLEERAVFTREHTPGKASGLWTWAAYSGHASAGAAADALCPAKGMCPLLRAARPVLGSGCRIDGSCDPVTAGLRLPGQASPLWPGQVAPWGQTPEGKVLYSALLTRGWSEERCVDRARAAGFAYLMLEGLAPHPLIRVESDDVVLDSIPRWIGVDGSGSVPVVQGAGSAAYLDAYHWQVTPPPGHPRISLSEADPQPFFSVYLAGTYDVALAVRDSKTNLTSEAEAEARVVVRPRDALHVELVWDDPDADLNLILLPPTATGASPNPAAAWAERLWQGQLPDWARAGTDTLAALDAQPDGHPLEVIRVGASVAQQGPIGLAVDQSLRAVPATVRASVRVYAFGQRIDEGQFEELLVGPDAVITLGRVSVTEARILPW